VLTGSIYSDSSPIVEEKVCFVFFFNSGPDEENKKIFKEI
jgi:hypothetical protein